ncbi:MULTISPECIES: glycosyltransferase family 2 protein [Micromonospora]|uniref:Glycosyltransferase family 2 protein n=1 Tax=Micromonospora humidisoli TaxID=2807622 RepID=A0ABS2JDQ5_9ACTN|nr:MULTISPECIES: glycosyltransferase family 2 protein [Micromonospora]MBM7083853.1 glycosyltransferase family 2 protein [Micromonospora humidisoli]WKU07238.1 glycosyltransferase [Micromonospora sp. HUAS LYJ1]GHJ06929.1 glycosyl transferase [Micromonospora sp. AKA109]
MANSRRCSVVIPTYDRADLLAYTLESLSRQSLPTDRFEVLIGDDGSTDHTASVIDRYRDRLDLHHLFQEHDGVGVTRARNRCIRRATGEICVLLDSGVMAHSGLLAAHLARHESTPDPLAVIGYVYGFTLDGDDSELERMIDPWDADATIAGFAARGEHPDVRDEFYRRYHDDFADLPAPWIMYWTCNVSARTSQLRDVGMFDESFRNTGGDDLDLAYRLHCDDARFVLDRAASAVHYPHPKDFAQNLKSMMVNYHCMIEKYRSPVMPLLLAAPTIHPFNINDVIAALRLPPAATRMDGKHAR